MPTFFRAGEKPVASADDQGLYATFTGIVTNLYEGMVKVDQKSGPAIEGVGDSFAKFSFWQLDKFCLIEPGFEQSELRSSESLAQVCAFQFRETGSIP